MSLMATKPLEIPQSIARILVPVDFSATSLHAAQFAFVLARQLGCEVRCTTVIDVLDLRIAMRAGLHDFETNEDLQQKVGQWIDGEFDKLAATAGVTMQREVRRGVPEDEILKTVARYKPDLIVMGSAGVTNRFPIGSRTSAMMRETMVPVLVIRRPGQAS